MIAKAAAMMKAARVDNPNFPLRDNKPSAGGTKQKNQIPNNRTMKGARTNKINGSN